MRSLSEVLIKKREEKNMTIEQVSYETNISKDYLRALESEDFSVFPAEAYLLGFLRNYSEFLGLDYDNIYSEYKNCLIREEPVPLNELVGKRKPIEFHMWMLVVPVVIILLVLIIPPSIKGVSSYIENRKESLRAAALEAQVREYAITSEYVGYMVTPGDSFVMQIDEQKLTLSIIEISNELVLKETFSGETRNIALALGNEEEITYFDQDGNSYFVTIMLNDIGGFSDNSAEIKVRKSVISEDVDIIEFSEDIGVIQGEDEGKVLMTLRRSTMPYSLNVAFEGDILFRYQELGKDVVENLYRSGSSMTIEVTRSIQIWTSNAGLTKLRVDNNNVVIGKTGAVSVFALKWIYYKDRDEYRLEYHETF